MATIVLIALGWSAFVIGTLVLGLWLRKHPNRPNAEKASRVVHLLYFAGLVFPGVLALFYPGLAQFDAIVGIPPLPFQPVSLILGVIALLMGLVLSVVSNQALRSRGRGANAFVLTKQIVDLDVYTHTRNPMSLGYYLVCLGIGLAAGSTFVTAGVLLGIIPAHLFFLKYFEELELELRFGEPYVRYKQSVPFLIPRWSHR